MLNPTQTPATAPTTHKYHTNFAKALARYPIGYHDHQMKKKLGAETRDLGDFRMALSKEMASIATARGLHNRLTGSFPLPADVLRPNDERQAAYVTWYQDSLSMLTFDEMLPDTVRKTTRPLARTIVKEMNAALRHTIFAVENNPVESHVDVGRLLDLTRKLTTTVVSNEASVNEPAYVIARRLLNYTTNESGDCIANPYYHMTTSVLHYAPFVSFYSKRLVCAYPGLFDCSRTSPKQMARLIRMWGDVILIGVGLHETETTGLVLLAALKVNHPVLYDLVMAHINERKRVTPTLSAALPDSVLPKTKDEAQYMLRTRQDPENNSVYPRVQVLLDIRSKLEEKRIDAFGYVEYVPCLRYTRLLGLEGNLILVHADGQSTRNMQTRIADPEVEPITEPPTVQVEFYASVADKMRGKKTRMKLGRFIKKYLHADDELTLYMVEAVRNRYAPKEVTVIPDTDQLSWSYVYANASVKSCMTPDLCSDKDSPNSSRARAMQAYAIGAALERIRSEAVNTNKDNPHGKPGAKHAPQTSAELEAYYTRKADALQGWLETAPRLALVVMHNANDTATATTRADSQATNQTDPSRWLGANISARAVVNITSKTYNKVYGDTRLARWLQDNGYRYDEGTTFGALLFVEERATLESVTHNDGVVRYRSYVSVPYVDGSVYGQVLDNVVLPDESSPFAQYRRTGVEAGYQSRWLVVEVMPTTDSEDILHTENGDRRVNVLSLHEPDTESYTIWTP